jgi:biopolymer transport protein ExbD
MDFGRPPRRRRPNLTPMIDVVFLLLVFFMLVSRFTTETSLPIMTGGTGQDWSGPPRIVELSDEGLKLNGKPVDPDALAGELRNLLQDENNAIVLRVRGDRSLQESIDILDLLSSAGMRRVVLVE